MDLRDKLREVRLEKGYNLKDFSKKARVHTQQIVNWESKICYPPKKRFKGICEVLGLPTNNMLKLYMEEKISKEF